MTNSRFYETVLFHDFRFLQKIYTEDCESFFIVQSLFAYLYLVQACFEPYSERYRQQTATEKDRKRWDSVLFFFDETCENEKLGFSVNIVSMAHVSSGHRMCFTRGSPGAARNPKRTLTSDKSTWLGSDIESGKFIEWNCRAVPADPRVQSFSDPRRFRRATAASPTVTVAWWEWIIRAGHGITPAGGRRNLRINSVRTKLFEIKIN